MSQIIVSANELTKKKEALAALKKTLGTQISQFEAEGKKLDSMWEGAAKKKYSMALTIDVSKLKMIMKLVEDFIKVLSTIIALYNLMEKKNLSVASS